MQKNRIQKFAACIIVLFVLLPGKEVFANYFTVTPGVEYSKGPTNWNRQSQSIHTIEVDVGRPEISVEALLPNTLTTRTPLTTLLQRASSNGRHVVAGMNASFFHMNSGAPSYLLASDDVVNTYGVISTGNNEYMSVPSAFGINKDGKGHIGTFGYEASVQTPSGVKKINSINKERGTGEIVLYTPTYSYGSTRSNTYGMEFVLTNLSSSIEENYRLGTPITATVDKILRYGGRDSVIPRDGVVLSIQGGSLAAEFGDVEIGSELTFSVDLSDPWKQADFVLASGPLLVQKGKVDLTINPESSRATAREPRSAVAVNADGSKVFFVTVDGRRTNSRGMTLSEFGSYLVSLGAYAALNLDGGGSTSMAVRDRGKQFPQLFNAPSDGYERPVSAVLGAVSYTEVGQARTIAAKLSNSSTLLKGGTTSIQVESALDVNFHVVPINQDQVSYSVKGDIGTISSTGVFTANSVGKGEILASFGNATKSFPIEVLEAPAKITISGVTGEIGPGQNVKYIAKAYDQLGRELAFSSSLVKWTASSSLGTITASGELQTNQSGKGNVTAQIGTKSASIPLEILNGGKLIHSFERSSEWQAESARAVTSLRFDGKKAPLKDGATGLTLSYDFTAYPSGTSASYAVSKTPIKLSAKPTALGLWVYGDGMSHWLRGTMTDAVGKEFTIDFTKEGGLNWSGWKYIRTQIPASIQGPVSLKRIYIAETSTSRKNKGSVYFDRLVAEYGTSHRERLFNDVSLSYWAIDDIAGAVEKGWINGYTDGTFKPEQDLTRAHAAVLLSRALRLNGGSELPFNDVSANHPYKKEIAAVYQAGIMTGKGDGKTFDPNGTLTRAQMAKMLVQAYSLSKGNESIPALKDVKSGFWAYEDIQTLQANGITVVSDGNYRPNESVKRSQFATFMMRSDR